MAFLKKFRRQPVKEQQDTAKAKETRDVQPDFYGTSVAKTNIFGVPLCEQVSRTEDVPRHFRAWCEQILLHGLCTEGLFRLGVDQGEIERLRSKYNEGKTVDLNGQNTHTLAALIKTYLADLPEPLLGFGGYRKLLEAGEMTDEKQRLFAINDVCFALPSAERAVLRFFTAFLSCVAECEENKMNTRALALVIGPLLLRHGSSSAGDMPIVARVVQILITEHQRLFGMDPIIAQLLSEKAMAKSESSGESGSATGGAAQEEVSRARMEVNRRAHGIRELLAMEGQLQGAITSAEIRLQEADQHMGTEESAQEEEDPVMLDAKEECLSQALGIRAVAELAQCRAAASRLCEVAQKTPLFEQCVFVARVGAAARDALATGGTGPVAFSTCEQKASALGLPPPVPAVIPPLESEKREVMEKLRKEAVGLLVTLTQKLDDLAQLAESAVCNEETLNQLVPLACLSIVLNGRDVIEVPPSEEESPGLRNSVMKAVKELEERIGALAQESLAIRAMNEGYPLAWFMRSVKRVGTAPELLDSLDKYSLGVPQFKPRGPPSPLDVGNISQFRQSLNFALKETQEVVVNLCRTAERASGGSLKTMARRMELIGDVVTLYDKCKMESEQPSRSPVDDEALSRLRMALKKTLPELGGRVKQLEVEASASGSMQQCVALGRLARVLELCLTAKAFGSETNLQAVNAAVEVSERRPAGGNPAIVDQRLVKAVTASLSKSVNAVPEVVTFIQTADYSAAMTNAKIVSGLKRLVDTFTSGNPAVSAPQQQPSRLETVRTTLMSAIGSVEDIVKKASVAAGQSSLDDTVRIAKVMRCAKQIMDSPGTGEEVPVADPGLSIPEPPIVPFSGADARLLRLREATQGACTALIAQLDQLRSEIQQVAQESGLVVYGKRLRTFHKLLTR